MNWITRWIRPTALTGLTTGLPFVGTVQEGDRTCRVYSGLAVVTKDSSRIEFEGGAAVSGRGHISTGRVAGKIVSTFRDDRRRSHFFAITFLG